MLFSIRRMRYRLLPEFQVVAVYKVLSRYLNLSDTVEVSSCRHIQATLFNIRRIGCRSLLGFQVVAISRLCYLI